MRILYLYLMFVLLILIVACNQNEKTENQNQNIKEVENMKLTSPSFENNNFIPDMYGANFDNINPALEIQNVPKNAKSLVLIMDDPDALKPAGKVWDHWIVWNIDPNKNVIYDNTVPGIQGVNSAGKNSYGGPRPPDGTHRYFFKLYALDTKLNIPNSSKKKDVENAMQGHIIEKAELIGLYSPK